MQLFLYPPILYNDFFFYFNHFSLIIFYHLVWLGFELFGLRVQVHSIWYTLRSRAKDMTITIVIINPRKEMRLECGWRHAQKRWAKNLEDFEKDLVEFQPWRWEVGVRPGSWGFEIGPCRQTIEFLSLGQRMEFSAIEFSTVAAAIKFFWPWRVKMNWDLKYHEKCRTFGGVFSIVWLRKTFKNCVSLLEEPNSRS